MTSERKVAANRLNGRKSRGPRSAAGKPIDSRNALRHGFARIHQPVSATDMECFARALCGNNNNPSLFEQAMVIARNDLVLRAISAQQLAVVERVREPWVIALARGDNTLKLARERFRNRDKAYNECEALRDKLLEKYKEQLPPPDPSEQWEPDIEQLVPVDLEIFLEQKERELASNAQDPAVAKADKIEDGMDVRDESAALEEAARDLVRLERYERRAWSMQKRAIGEFINIRLMLRLDRGASQNAWQMATAQTSGPAPVQAP